MYGYTGDGNSATNAKLKSSTGVSVDDSANIYIADDGASVIRKVSAATGIITTIAGNGTSGFSGDGGPATNAQLNYAAGVCTNGTGSIIYIADKVNNRIRKVYSTASVNNLAQFSWPEITPNPNSGIFTIGLDENIDYSISVTNTLGQIIRCLKVQGCKQKSIDITDFPKGNYILKVNTANNTFTRMFVMY